MGVTIAVKTRSMRILGRAIRVTEPRVGVSYADLMRLLQPVNAFSFAQPFTFFDSALHRVKNAQD